MKSHARRLQALYKLLVQPSSAQVAAHRGIVWIVLLIDRAASVRLLSLLRAELRIDGDFVQRLRCRANFVYQDCSVAVEWYGAMLVDDAFGGASDREATSVRLDANSRVP